MHDAPQTAAASDAFPWRLDCFQSLGFLSQVRSRVSTLLNPPWNSAERGWKPTLCWKTSLHKEPENGLSPVRLTHTFTRCRWPDGNCSSSWCSIHMHAHDRLGLTWRWRNRRREDTGRNRLVRMWASAAAALSPSQVCSVRTKTMLQTEHTNTHGEWLYYQVPSSNLSETWGLWANHMQCPNSTVGLVPSGEMEPHCEEELSNLAECIYYLDQIAHRTRLAWGHGPCQIPIFCLYQQVCRAALGHTPQSLVHSTSSGDRTEIWRDITFPVKSSMRRINIGSTVWADAL